MNNISATAPANTIALAAKSSYDLPQLGADGTAWTDEMPVGPSVTMYAESPDGCSMPRLGSWIRVPLKYG